MCDKCYLRVCSHSYYFFTSEPQKCLSSTRTGIIIFNFSWTIFYQHSNFTATQYTIRSCHTSSVQYYYSMDIHHALLVHECSSKTSCSFPFSPFLQPREHAMQGATGLCSHQLSMESLWPWHYQSVLTATHPTLKYWIGTKYGLNASNTFDRM